MRKPKYNPDSKSDIDLFEKRCTDYLSKHDIFVDPPSIVGLKNALQVTSHNLVDWKKSARFQVFYQMYRQYFYLIQERLTVLLLSKDYSNSGLIFYFKNVFGYRDNNSEANQGKVIVQIETDNKSPIKLKDDAG